MFQNITIYDRNWCICYGYDKHSNTFPTKMLQVWFDVNISLTLKHDELLVTLRKNKKLMPFDLG